MADHEITRLFNSLTEEVAKKQQGLLEQEEALKKAREFFEAEKEAVMKVGMSEDDVLDINVGGEVVTEKRSTFLLAPEDSLLHSLFSGRWDDSFDRDSQGRIFLSFTPHLFKKIVSHLRTLRLAPPGRVLQPPCVERADEQEFHVMLDYLGLVGFLQRRDEVDIKLHSVHGNVAITDFSRTATHTGTTHTAVVGAEPLPCDGATWKVVVRSLRNNYWLYVGVIGNASPHLRSFGDATSFGWACLHQVFVRGTDNPGYGLWSGWQAGDVAILRLDLVRGTLRMHCSRLNRCFELTGLPGDLKDWRVHINLHGQGDCVEVSGASASEAGLVA